MYIICLKKIKLQCVVNKYIRTNIHFLKSKTFAIFSDDASQCNNDFYIEILNNVSIIVNLLVGRFISRKKVSVKDSMSKHKKMSFLFISLP